MFAYYGRSETSFVCAVGSLKHHFQKMEKEGFAIEVQQCFPRRLEENEFVLLLERNDDWSLTGRELTLFVDSIHNGVIKFVVVTETPDVFWAKQKSEV